LSVAAEGSVVPFLIREAVVAESSPLLAGRIDRCVQELSGGSRSFVTGLFDHDCVQVNGQPAPDPGYRLEAGDHVVIRYEADRRYSPKRRPRQEHNGFSIVYEDRELIVVDKSAALLTVPTLEKEPYTLIYRVNEHVRHEGRGRGAFIVHRLDRGVSGLLVFGKTQELAEQLQKQFAEHKPDRLYHALVADCLKSSEGEFRGYLATGRTLTRYSTSGPQSGELAVTRYRVIQSMPDTTHVEVRLETGRRNQIRVQFAEAGHPVLGETRYSPELARRRDWPHRRLALHAATLAIENPATHQILRFTSPLPVEMTKFVQTREQMRRNLAHAAEHPAPETSPAGRPARPKSNRRRGKR